MWPRLGMEVYRKEEGRSKEMNERVNAGRKERG